MSRPLRASIGNSVIEVRQGDITEEAVEAIVNPANSYMIMGGGVAGAIKRKGGVEIEREATSKAPVRVGEAIYTRAGRLKAKYVIHAPTMEEPGSPATLDNVRAAVRAALSVAEQLGVNSIAFPGMGTGVGGLDYYEAAKAMVSEIIEFLRSASRPPKIVVLVAYDKDLYDAFSYALSNLLPCAF